MTELLALVPVIPMLLVAGLLLMIVLVVAVIFAVQYDKYQRRLPNVARLGNLDARIEARQEELIDLEGKISTRRNYSGRLSMARPARAIWMATKGLYPWFAMDCR